MLKIIGFVTLIAAAAVGGLYFSGYMDGNVEATVTEKGANTYNTGLETVRDGINTGLDQMKAGQQK